MTTESSDAPSDEGCSVLLRINLLDCFASSTKVKAGPSTTTNDLCEILSTKLDQCETDAMFYSLVCVSSCMDKKKMHWVRTLKANELVLQVQADMEEKAIKRCATPVVAETVTSSFFYKDIRSNPLNLDGEASGNSSSDDEMEIPLNDLLYFGSGERRGFLQKRSSRDPNVWRRRLCILNDKLWCINVRKDVPSASCVNLNDTTVLEDRPDLKYTNTITLSGNNGLTLFYRTNSPLEKHRWREEIRERTLYGADNEVIMMAEMIITDEEEMGELQMQKCFRKILQTPQVWRLVRRILGLTADFADSVAVVRGEGTSSTSTRSEQQHQQEKKEKENISTGGEKSRSRLRSQTIESSASPPTHQSRGSRNSRGSRTPPRGVKCKQTSDTLNSSSNSNRRRTYSVQSEDDGSDSCRGKSNSSLAPLSAPQNDLRPSKKFGRWASQIFHMLHQSNPACAAGVALICAVQHFKGAFRHDFYVRPKELWGNALHVYIYYILPYMDFIKSDSISDLEKVSSSVREESDLVDTSSPLPVRVREESVEVMEHRKDTVLERPSFPDAPSSSSSSSSTTTADQLSPSQHISMEQITQLHRALFSNIRKKRKKAHVFPTKDNNSAPASPSYSTWFWSSSTTVPSTSIKSQNGENNSSKESDNNDNDDIYNTDYAVLDSNIKPNMDMFDEFVQAIYKKLEE